MRPVEYFMDKAREADRHADREDDPELKQNWIKIAAFWLSAAERALDSTTRMPAPLARISDVREKRSRPLGMGTR